MSYPDARIDTPSEARDSLSREEAMAQILTIVPLSREDLDGFLACSPEEQAALMTAYRDANLIVSPTAWSKVLAVLGACAEFANLVTPIAGVVQLVFGLTQL